MNELKKYENTILDPEQLLPRITHIVSNGLQELLSRTSRSCPMDSADIRALEKFSTIAMGLIKCKIDLEKHETHSDEEPPKIQVTEEQLKALAAKAREK